MSFDCPNSTYEILLKKKNTENDLAMLIQGKFEAKCGIVYCVFKHNSEKLVQKFKDNFNIMQCITMLILTKKIGIFLR